MQPSPQSEIELANLALAAIGEAAIVSLVDATIRAREVSRQFGFIRDMLLRETSWNFANGDTVPAALPPPSDGRFAFRYALPSDCLMVRQVVGITEDAWEVEGSIDGTQLTLVTSATAPRVLFTRRVDPIIWDAMFRACFVASLASALAPKLARDAALGERQQAIAAAMLMRAKRRDAREKAPHAVNGETSWIAARRVSYGR